MRISIDIGIGADSEPTRFEAVTLSPRVALAGAVSKSVPITGYPRVSRSGGLSKSVGVTASPIVSVTGSLSRSVAVTASPSGHLLTPKEVANCVLWLRADRGITITGSGVSTAADQSTAGNDATQTTDASRMQLITDTDGKAAIGETADAANLSLNLPANFYNFWKNTSGEPFTVIMLSRRIGNSPSAAVNLVTWGNVNYAPFRIPAGSPPAHYNNFFASTAVGVYTDAPSTSWESLASTFTGTSVRFYQNGSEDASSPQAINASTCGAAAAINMLNMLWREIAVYQRVLSTAERNGIENGMRMRWGLSAV